MGTRGLTAVVVDGEYKIAQYGQWDHYPSHQGVTALAFARRLADGNVYHQFVEKCKAVKVLTQDEIAALNNTNWRVTHPQLNRDQGADILNTVLNADAGLPLVVRPQFAHDSLFCEYGYVIDLDKNTFEVYKGFNTAPLPEGERFSCYTGECPESPGYYAIRHIKTYGLGALPDTDDEFIDMMAELMHETEDE